MTDLQGFAPDGSTRLFAVLGDPVEHSRSPALHNAFLRARGRNGLYLGLPARSGDLATLLPALHRLPFDGLNLTTPFKEEAVPLCSSLCPRAEALGAVNTLRRTEAGWEGRCTDGDGLLLWLSGSLGFDPAGQDVVVLGAGGAARAAVQALLSAGASVEVATRNPARFEEGFFREGEGRAVRPVSGEAVGSASLFEGADLVLHATPFGLGGAAGEPPWDLHALRTSAAVVVDMNYRLEGPTPFLAALAREGHDGRGMLAGQAVLAFETWTGERPSLEEALRAL